MELSPGQASASEAEISFTVFLEIKRVILNSLLAEIDAGLILAELSAAMSNPSDAATALMQAWTCYRDCIQSVQKHEVLDPAAREFVLSRAAMLRDRLGD
jgi:hypothetical protein